MSKKTNRDLVTLGRNIRLCRQAVNVNISQIELAKRVGISNRQLSNIEAAKNWPSLQVYIALCRELSGGGIIIPLIPNEP
jgi:transcriptional regulator with XRE-family HTH domain